MLCIQYPCKYLLLRQYPRAIFAMKCSAAEAGFPVEGQAIRVTVCVPADRCTRNEPMTLSLVYHNSDNVDTVKKILAYRIREITGRCPRIPCFQLYQNGRHIPFTEPIIGLTIMDAVYFVRTAPDFRNANEWNQNAMTIGSSAYWTKALCWRFDIPSLSLSLALQFHIWFVSAWSWF